MTNHVVDKTLFHNRIKVILDVVNPIMTDVEQIRNALHTLHVDHEKSEAVDSNEKFHNALDKFDRSLATATSDVWVEKLFGSTIWESDPIRNPRGLTDDTKRHPALWAFTGKGAFSTFFKKMNFTEELKLLSRNLYKLHANYAELVKGLYAEFHEVRHLQVRLQQQCKDGESFRSKLKAAEEECVNYGEDIQEFFDLNDYLVLVELTGEAGLVMIPPKVLDTIATWEFAGVREPLLQRYKDLRKSYLELTGR